MREKLNGRKSRAESLRSVLNDHEMLEEYIDGFNRLFTNGTTTIPKDAAAVTREFSQKLIGHFAYEEEHIFPALRAAMPSADAAQLISELREEHDDLERKAKQLSKMLSPANLNGQNVRLLRMAMEDLGNQMQRHSTKENELFPSLL
jgi:iron-sulfur cluster repair protein YtfE (RIC family)